jgi:5'-3' exonuclease
MFLLARQEARKMCIFQQDLIRHTNEQPEWGPFEKWEDEWGQYQHTAYYLPGHPEHNKVRDQLLSFNYNDVTQHEKTKGHYYKVNFGLNPDGDKREYNIERAKICKTYIKSLIFTLKYYLSGKPPSWRWNYHYEVAPWPSDIFVALKNTDLKKLGEFYENIPYRSMEQLLLTVPPTSSVFPAEFRPFANWLPPTTNIVLDLLNGDKYIYAEPILRGINEPRLLEEIHKVPLTPANAKRNQVNRSEFIYNRNKKTKTSE